MDAQNDKVETLGQVFTPPEVVQAMLGLRRRQGRVLEPSCGDGAFFCRLPGATGIELDAAVCPPGALQQDFFAYPVTEKFDTIIGNPPYVRWQDIPLPTRALFDTDLFDARSNLFLFFIEKCLRHLAPGGELIFITPRDFLKLSGAVRLNRRLCELGSITHAIDLGDAHIFRDALPNCLIWRFERDNFSRTTQYAEISTTGTLRPLQALADPCWEERQFGEFSGHLAFLKGQWSLHVRDLFSVKVGAVSGDDEIFVSARHGTRDFVCSSTVSSGLTRRMIWQPEAPHAALLPHRERLLARRIKPFDDSNWWQWGRGYPENQRPRIYVNGRTRVKRPFFLHDCQHFDGAVLALFPHDEKANLARLCKLLNDTDWAALGFICDGRYLFTQRSLENSPLPDSFMRFRRAAAAASLSRPER
ncbi:MAG: class I SAM-dependent methyltransferase [Rhodocyclaceae bacterium]|nr:class I SAM-dependent methyltransferase [Rhodocyclaceae bacterium]MBX3670818.1 class I SAM-dependent methyltransferase [Rhodocyclaceae bacterium]